MYNNDTWTKVIAVNGKNGIRVETSVHEHPDYYESIFIVNGTVVFKQLTLKPEPETLFKDLKAGEYFTLKACGDDVFIKLKEDFGGRTAVCIKDGDSQSIGAPCFIRDRAVVLNKSKVAAITLK